MFVFLLVGNAGYLYLGGECVSEYEPNVKKYNLS